MSSTAPTGPGVNGPRRGRRVLMAAGALVLAGAAAFVLLGPGTTFVTTDLARTDPSLEAAPEQRVRFSADDVTASTLVARSHDTGWGTAIQIIVERPRPALQSLEIELGTDTLGVAPDEVMLATPGGDWPPITFDTTAGGDVAVRADGIDWTSTAQLRLYLPEAAVEEDQTLSLPVRVDLEQAGTPSLTSWAGSTSFDLSLEGTVG